MPVHAIGPTGPGVPWLAALVAKPVTSSPSGSLAGSVIVTGVSSGVVAGAGGRSVGGSCVLLTLIVNAFSTNAPSVSVARTRIE